MSIIGWIILGGLAGWIASMLTGRNDRQGCLMNIIVGVVGAAIGGAIVGLFGGGGVTGFNLGSLLVAILGAVVLLAIVNFFTRSK
jgi:uncharacterized membrane protein YeaQ/YmgE (transglycosylase-associated protein family)